MDDNEVAVAVGRVRELETALRVMESLGPEHNTTFVITPSAARCYNPTLRLLLAHIDALTAERDAVTLERTP